MPCALGDAGRPLGGQEAPPRPEEPPQQDPLRGGMELMKTADTVTWAMLKIKKIEDRLAHACSVGQFMGLNTLVSMVWIVLLWVPHGSQTKRETKKHGKHTKETIKDLVFFSH